jgi:hypothetical protein
MPIKKVRIASAVEEERKRLQTLLCTVHEHLGMEIAAFGRRDCFPDEHIERVCSFFRIWFLIFT